MKIPSVLRLAVEKPQDLDHWNPELQLRKNFWGIRS